jgi:uncharacterized membrane protein YeaQ/YmgE (transglycosylase-associated protein family)
MDLVSLIISAVSGVAGGNVSGAAAPDKSLGVAGNSITGLLGGAFGGYLLQAFELLNKSGVLPAGAENAVHGLDFGAILGDIASGGVGGGVVTFIVGLLKNMMQK